ncbi:MAG: hypothetical protein M0010_00625 [Actinomycetota bacterium]|nr:hypothetical protein [Actinomycetota bacterium]
MPRRRRTLAPGEHHGKGVVWRVRVPKRSRLVRLTVTLSELGLRRRNPKKLRARRAG